MTCRVPKNKPHLKRVRGVWIVLARPGYPRAGMRELLAMRAAYDFVDRVNNP